MKASILFAISIGFAGTAVAKDKPAQLVGYTVSYDLTVRVRDLTELGAVVDDVE